MPNALADLVTEGPVHRLEARLAARLDTARTCVRPARSGAISRVVGLRFDVDGLDLPIGATVKSGRPVGRAVR